MVSGPSVQGSRHGRRRVERTLRVGDAQVHLLGTIVGFVPDGARVQAALDQGAIDCVGLGIPPEDLEGLRMLMEGKGIHAAGPVIEGAAAPAAGAPGLEGIHAIGEGHVPKGADDDAFQALDPTQQRFLELPGRYGETRVPSPDLDVAYRWAQDNHAPVEALDLDDEAHASVYIRQNKFRHVIRSGRILKRIMKEEFKDADGPHAFAVAWDDYLNSLPSLQGVEASREEHMAQRIQELAKVHDAIVAVVPAPRFAGVVARLESTPS